MHNFQDLPILSYKLHLIEVEKNNYTLIKNLRNEFLKSNI